MDESRLREMMHAEGERWAPQADPVSLAERLTAPEPGGPPEPRSSRRARRRARDTSVPGILGRLRPLSIAMVLLLLVASGVGIWAAARNTARAKPPITPAGTHGSRGSTTTAPATTTEPPEPTTPSYMVLSNDPATVPNPLPAAVNRPRDAVPWPSVGPGWTLFLDDTVRCTCADLGSGSVHEKGSGYDGLFLVSPSGTRYVIDNWKVRAGEDWGLVGWSLATEHLLLSHSLAKSPEKATTVELDLVTGDASAIPVRGAVGFASNGVDVITDQSASASTLEADLVSPSGARLSVLAKGPGVYADAVQGGEVVGSDTLSFVNASGKQAALDPAGQRTCTLVRLWSATSVLATCSASPSGYPTHFWVLSVAGAAPTPISLPAAKVAGPSGSPWNGSTSMPLDLYELPTGTYVTDAGACGTTFIGKQDGSVVEQLVPPGVSSGANMRIIGSAGDDLLVQVTNGCTVPQEVMSLDTVTGRWTVVFESRAGQVGFEGDFLVAALLGR